MSDLRPVHFSLMNKTRVPHEMTALNVSHEHKAALTKVALDIFVDASNVGVAFQNAILAVYLSGIDCGRSIATENTK